MKLSSGRGDAIYRPVSRQQGFGISGRVAEELKFNFSATCSTYQGQGMPSHGKPSSVATASLLTNPRPDSESVANGRSWLQVPRSNHPITEPRAAL